MYVRDGVTNCNWNEVFFKWHTSQKSFQNCWQDIRFSEVIQVNLYILDLVWNALFGTINSSGYKSTRIYRHGTLQKVLCNSLALFVSIMRVH